MFEMGQGQRMGSCVASRGRECGRGWRPHLPLRGAAFVLSAHLTMAASGSATMLETFRSPKPLHAGNLEDPQTACTLATFRIPTRLCTVATLTFPKLATFNSSFSLARSNHCVNGKVELSHVALHTPALPSTPHALRGISARIMMPLLSYHYQKAMVQGDAWRIGCVKRTR